MNIHKNETSIEQKFMHSWYTIKKTIAIVNEGVIR